MEEPDLTKIKYFPDRFYICLDGFDIENLTTFITDLSIGQNQSIFIHEYYHYLTNIATFSGIRQFALNFCDRFKATTILAFQEGINAFPINTNNLEQCKDMVKYWNDTLMLLDDFDIDYNVVREVDKSPGKKFEIADINKVIKPLNIIVDGKMINGGRNTISIRTFGLLEISAFDLTFGAIDEFLSCSIDEYLYENDLAEIQTGMLSKRPFYPYLFFDEILSFYEIRRASSFEKILLSYFALQSTNPPVVLIDILEKLRDGDYNMFQDNPEEYLKANVENNEMYSVSLNYIKDMANLCFDQGRIHISQALKYFYDKFFIAQKLKEDDFFYFIRPFFAKSDNTVKMKQEFLLALSRIINVFTPPVILKDKQFFYVDKLTSFGEATMLILATYEIFESIRTQQIANRPQHYKAKYTFPDQDLDADNFEKFTPPPINGTVFRLALNEINLYKIYLDELGIRRKLDKAD